MVAAYVAGTLYYGELVHTSGHLSAQLLIAALAVTPLRLMFSNARWTAWLVRQRRYLGVAAFGYAALHAAVYLHRLADFGRIAAEARELGMLAGWLALAVMLALAATSNSALARRLRRAWKKLHRFAYAAALLTLAHWYLEAFDPVPGLVQFAALAALESYRVWHVYGRSRLARLRAQAPRPSR